MAVRTLSPATLLVVCCLLVGSAAGQASANPYADLPVCTDEQLKIIEVSYSCIARQFGPDGTGLCPDDCCCDVLASDEGTTRKYVAPKGCALESSVGPSSEILGSAILPYSVEEGGSPEGCAKTIPWECVETVGEGCQFDHTRIYPEAAAAGDGEEANEATTEGSVGETEESETTTTSNEDKDDDDDETTSGSANSNEAEDGSRGTIMGLGVALAALCFLFAGVVLFFCVRPMIKGEPIGFMGKDPGNSSKLQEIDEELMDIDMQSRHGSAPYGDYPPGDAPQSDPRRM